LSENCLGDIISINPYAESVFGFESKELIGKTVNNIMPITFAAYHDSLLKVFLRNRYKKVNGDERVLVAKHKNGMIFPIMLRLQRVIASADELIFIANIRRYKTRESPMMFIATPEGEVVDYSVGFQFYFMSKHSKK
jgi:PAS domain S-box-containing protein